MRKRGRSESRSRSRHRSRSRDGGRSHGSSSGKHSSANRRRKGRSSSRERSIYEPDNRQSSFPLDEVELFVGNLTSSDTTEEMLKDFLNLAMRESKLVYPGSPDPIVACRLTHRYGFIEFLNPDFCTKGLNLNGIPFLNSMLRIRRPARYEGPIKEGLTWQELTGDSFIPQNGDISAESYEDQSTFQHERTQKSNYSYSDSSSHGRKSQTSAISTAYYYATKPLRELFIGNITEPMNNDSVREFLGGALLKMGMSSSSSENPIQDIKVTGKFAFIVCYTAEDAANMLNLNGIPFLSQSLKIERPSKFDSEVPGTTYFKWDELYNLWCSGQLKLMTAGPMTRVLQISNMATAAELLDNNYYLDLIQETRAECSQFGMVKSVIIPRSSQPGSGSIINDKDIGRVFVEMNTIMEAQAVLLNLKGRTFSGRCVDVKFYPEEKFRSFDYSFENPHIIITSSFGPVLKEQVLTPAALQKLAMNR